MPAMECRLRLRQCQMKDAAHHRRRALEHQLIAHDLNASWKHHVDIPGRAESDMSHKMRQLIH